MVGTGVTARAAIGDEAAARSAAIRLDELLTMGVEEEFLLIDPDSGQVVPAVERVMARIPSSYAEAVQHEFLSSQIEIASPPTVSLSELRQSLVELRRVVCDAAEAEGVRAVALGTGPLRWTDAPSIVEIPRYQEMGEQFGHLWPSPGLSGCHVHVGVPDRSLGVQVLNHLRAWLPVLHAVTANSPFFQGVETGYASWRSMLWKRWPTVGPPPHMDSLENYDEIVSDLVAAGAMLDDKMLYWYARLSSHVPTVEVRIGDVCPTVDDTLLVAALVRALVSTVVVEVAQGRAPRPVRDWLVEAAHWRAGRDGLDGSAVDVGAGTVGPAWERLDALVAHVAPALERHGDTEAVRDLLALLRARGNGATRQRQLYAATGSLVAVVQAMAAGTRP